MKHETILLPNNIDESILLLKEYYEKWIKSNKEVNPIWLYRNDDSIDITITIPLELRGYIKGLIDANSFYRKTTSR